MIENAPWRDPSLATLFDRRAAPRALFRSSAAKYVSPAADAGRWSSAASWSER
jgi:hypothetical protein